ncbi:hypothetical protein ABPG74_015353 [Tetrahymena malaccensis]
MEKPCLAIVIDFEVRICQDSKKAIKYAEYVDQTRIKIALNKSQNQNKYVSFLKCQKITLLEVKQRHIESLQQKSKKDIDDPNRIFDQHKPYVIARNQNYVFIFVAEHAQNHLLDIQIVQLLCIVVKYIFAFGPFQYIKNNKICNEERDNQDVNDQNNIPRGGQSCSKHSYQSETINQNKAEAAKYNTLSQSFLKRSCRVF